jgi:hypothetical protein
MKLEKYLAEFIQVKRANQTTEIIHNTIAFSQRIKEIIKEARTITVKIIPYVLL